MANIKLNIYAEGNKNEIEKTYTTETYDLMLGTVEDIMAIIDLEKLNDNTELIKMVIGCYGQLKPFLKDVFVGLTDDELKRVKVKELIPMFIELFNGIAETIGILNTGKN